MKNSPFNHKDIYNYQQRSTQYWENYVKQQQNRSRGNSKKTKTMILVFSFTIFVSIITLFILKTIDDRSVHQTTSYGQSNNLSLLKSLAGGGMSGMSLDKIKGMTGMSTGDLMNKFNSMSGEEQSKIRSQFGR